MDRVAVSPEGNLTYQFKVAAREADLKAPPGGSAQMQQSLENLRQSMRQMSAPLPEEPVGKGARWEMKISTVMEAEAAVPVPGGPPSTGAAAPTAPEKPAAK